MTAESSGSKRRGMAAARLAEVEEVEIEIEKLVAGGDGLGRWEGIPLFVPRAAPGDRLRVALVDRRPDYGRAEIVEVLTPGPGRRQPPCPHYARCGGCDLQHIEDDLQTELKAAAVIETLRRLGGIRLEREPQIVRGASWGYRLRAQLHTETAAESGRVRVGYHARGSRDLVPVDSCPILMPRLEGLLQELPTVLSGEVAPRRLDLAAGDEGISTAPVVEGLPHGPVSLSLELADGPLEYSYDARCFFQAHRGAVSELVERAVGPWKGGAAFDLYAGVGLFSLALARRYDRVTAVEGDRVAARYARKNARTNRLDGLQVIGQAVESWIAGLPAAAPRVLVDPPRGGLPLLVRKALVEARPRRLTYVSCHPATLARDLQRLLRLYRLEELTLIDLFPQTGHIEAVAQLVDPEGGSSE